MNKVDKMKLSLRGDVKTLRDISKTMETHGYYKSIPSVLLQIADDIEEYLNSDKEKLVKNYISDSRKNILERIEEKAGK